MIGPGSDKKGLHLSKLHFLILKCKKEARSSASTGYKAARSPRQVSNINQEAPKSGFMLQNWEARPFRGYYGSGRIAIGGFTSCERGSRSLGQMTLSKRVLAGNTSSPALDHLEDNQWRFTNATTVTMHLVIWLGNQLERTHINKKKKKSFGQQLSWTHITKKMGNASQTHTVSRWSTDDQTLD